MARYELVAGTSNKFFEIELGVKSCTTRWGRIGGAGENTKTRTYGSDAEAKQDHDRLVREKTTKGYTLAGKTKPVKRAKGDKPEVAAPVVEVAAAEPRNAKLDKLIRDDPDDAGNFDVLGDWLAAQGHPRGELVAMHARGLKKPAEKLLAKHPALWGDVASCRDMVTDVVWHRGFIQAAKVATTFERTEAASGSPVAAVDALGSLLDGPGRFLRRLTVGLVTNTGNSYEPITAVLAKRGPLPTLKWLYYGGFGYEETELNWSSIGKLEKLYAAVPNLESLTLRSGGAMKLGKIVLPKLRTFATVTGGLDAASAKAIAAATWPKLETLDLMIGSHGRPAPTVKDLMPILEAKGLPKLSWLGITNFTFHRELVAAVLSARVVKQLKTLDLSMGTMADPEAAILGAAKAKLGHLEQLIVGENYFTAAGMKALKQLGIKIVSTPSGKGSHGSETTKFGQRIMEAEPDPDDPDDEGERYASVYE